LRDCEQEIMFYIKQRSLFISLDDDEDLVT